MSNIFKGLAWASAILLTAALDSYGMISEDMGSTLFVVLPFVAVMSLRGETPGCKRCAS